jgi:hypothetical protein
LLFSLAERPYLQFASIGMIILVSGGFWAHLIESHRRNQRQLSDELEQLGFSYARSDQCLFVHGNRWPKYRRKVIYGKLRASVGGILRESCKPVNLGSGIAAGIVLLAVCTIVIGAGKGRRLHNH